MTPEASANKGFSIKSFAIETHSGHNYYKSIYVKFSQFKYKVCLKFPGSYAIFWLLHQPKVLALGHAADVQQESPDLGQGITGGEVLAAGVASRVLAA